MPTHASKPITFYSIIQTLRIHQWAKNLLIFIPVILAHEYRHPQIWLGLLRAFLAFSCIASAGYVLNDIFDIASDLLHDGKKSRPFAAGVLSRGFGFALAVILLTAGTTLAASVSRDFLIVATAYFVGSVVYSLFLKSLPLVDVFCLACFYVVRLFAGGVAATVVISPWLAAFAVFFFLNLAFLKRFTELNLHRQNATTNKIRGYLPIDANVVMAFGTAAGILSALVLALYMNSEHAFTLYRHPEFLWAICFFLLYWITRTWLIAHRGEMHDDPVVFVIHDRASYVVLLCCVIVLALAI